MGCRRDDDGHDASAKLIVEPLTAAFTRALADQFPADFASFDPDDLREYGRDWTRVIEPAASCVVLPRTTDEVSRFLALASAHGVAVVPSGGRTGLAGGAMASRGEVVLSLARMRTMGATDELGMTVRVQAGAITEAVHQHVAEKGLFWPVDFASKGSSHVGGNIATNAGGVKVIRYGLTRQWVLGLQVVLASGQVLELGGALEKDNTGPDLRQLFIGSEGILGVITEATLKLTKLPGEHDVFLFALSDAGPAGEHGQALANVLELFFAARRASFTVSAYEFFTQACLDRLVRHRARRLPFAEKYPVYVLLEIEDPARAAAGERSPGIEAWLEERLASGTVQDAVLAQHSGEAKELWSFREGISESLSATGMPHKNDISLPIAKLEGFVKELGHVFDTRYPDFEICLFGHVGDGNLHVNVMKPDAMSREDFLARTHEADATLFELVKKYEGSVSAEHGIGLLKKDALAYTRSPEEIALFRSLKDVFDPAGILNPGKIF